MTEGWEVKDGKLSRTFQLPTFPDAIAFVGKVAELAEAQDHHPDIDIRWRHVKVATCTHDAHNQITKFDVRLAERIDSLG